MGGRVRKGGTSMRLLRFPRPKAAGFRVITHLHSTASDGEASPLYSRVSAAIAEAVGEADAPKVKWHEALIRPETIEALLTRASKPIDLVCLTDHVTRRRHVFPEASLALARKYQNLILGAEISTAMWSAKRGAYVVSPEILLYGPTKPRGACERQPHYGLVQKDLDDLYASCVPEGAAEVEVNLGIAWAERKGYAWALAHPLDGNQLEISELFSLFVQARSLEALNGGYPTNSFRALSAYIDFHNAVVAEGGAPIARRRLDATTRALLSLLEQAQPRPLVPLGGSDAHLRNLDRVVTVVEPADEIGARPVAQVFLSAVKAGQGVEASFTPQGKGSSWLDLYREASIIVWKNYYENRAIIFAHPIRAFYVAAKTVRERLSTYADGHDVNLKTLARLGLKPADIVRLERRARRAAAR